MTTMQAFKWNCTNTQIECGGMGLGFNGEIFMKSLSWTNKERIAERKRTMEKCSDGGGGSEIWRCGNGNERTNTQNPYNWLTIKEVLFTPALAVSQSHGKLHGKWIAMCCWCLCVLQQKLTGERKKSLCNLHPCTSALNCSVRELVTRSAIKLFKEWDMALTWVGSMCARAYAHHCHHTHAHTQTFYCE